MVSQLTTTLAAHDDKLLACIHCGLCLEACPTYLATGDENDSPRGRIYLMRAVEEGRLALNSASFQNHIDRCLGCRACEPVCPAGVEYGQLLEGARGDLYNAAAKDGLTQRLLRFALRHIWLQRSRLKMAFTSARLARDAGLVRLLLLSKLPRLLSRRFEFALALLQSSAPRMWHGRPARVSAPETTSQTSTGRKPTRVSAAETTSRTSTGGTPVPLPANSLLLFQGCVTEGLFSRINRATARILKVNGYATRAPAEQTCCGALHAHAGDLDGARQLAQRNIEAFADKSGTPIITNAGGCGAMLASYPHLFAQQPSWASLAREFSSRVRDVSQQLVLSDITAGAAIETGSVTYDASCHLINGQHAGDAPLRLLEAIPNLEFVPLEGSDRCCGGAGVYNLMEPELSGLVLNEKLERVRDSGATTLATGNPGCHMQIAAGACLNGIPLRVCHPVELLDDSYRRAGLYAESEVPDQ